MSDTSETVLRALNSSSKLAQRQHCPGSARAEKGLPELDSEYSREGSLLHLHAAQPSLSRAKLDPEQRQVLERDQNTIDKFMEATKARLGISAEAKCVTIVEKELFLYDEEGELVVSHGENFVGHPDVIYWFPEFLTAIIIDHKFGRKGVAPAWINLQLRSYALMFSAIQEPETVIVAISQPWAKSPNDFHSAEYGKKDFPAFQREIIDIIRATEPKDAPRNASVDACTYCKACAYCPLAIEVGTEMAVVRVNEVSIQELEALAPKMELAKKVIDHWTKRMKYVAENFPDKLEKYELGGVKSRRSIPNVTLARQTLKHLTDLQFSDSVLDMCSTLSAKDLVDHICSVTKATSESGEDLLVKALGSLLVSVPMERSLVKKKVNVHESKKV